MHLRNKKPEGVTMQIFISVFLAVLISVGCSSSKAPNGNKGVQVGEILASKSGEVVAGQVAVISKDPASLEALKSRGEVKTIDKGESLYVVQSSDFIGKEKEVADELSASGLYELAEPVGILSIKSEAPRDPKWLSLWGLKNYGQDSPGGTEGQAGSDIGALGAWEVTTGSKKVVVAVIDTGVDYSHPDLQANMWINEKEKNGVPGVDDDGNGYCDDVYGWDFVSLFREKTVCNQQGDPDPMDDNGHGSHVGGTIGAVGNNRIGVTGVNWAVSIMALKFLSAEGSGTTIDSWRAIKYATKNGADIMSASFGGGPKSALIQRAIKEAGDAGLLFVAAAGNDGTNNDEDPKYPSNYELDNIISVAATDNRDNLASFSNYGYQTVDIAAPGVAVMSTYPVALAAKDAENSEPYRAFSGTSMATPHVSGAAALLLASDPSLKGKPLEIKKRLLESVDRLPHLASKVLSGGRLNLDQAIHGMTTSLVTQSGWQNEAYSLETPRFPEVQMNQIWEIKKEGAKAIQIHIEFAHIDEPYDVAVIYDSHYRPILSIPSMTADLWSPVIPGDRAYLKFSNSLVQIMKFTGTTKMPAPVPGGNCWKQGEDPNWECSTFEKGSIFPNHSSEGVIIDEIRYLPGNSGGSGNGNGKQASKGGKLK